MARPLPDGSRAEPTAAAVPGSRGGFALGGTLALPPPLCRSPTATTATLALLPPGLNCALCPAGAGPLPPRALYRCMRGAQPPRTRPAPPPHESPAALESSPPPEPPARLPPSLPPSLEQTLGARLRLLGDRFHRERQQQQQRPGWEHFCHFLLQLLGVFYNLPAEGGRLGLGPN